MLGGHQEAPHSPVEVTASTNRSAPRESQPVSSSIPALVDPKTNARLGPPRCTVLLPRRAWMVARGASTMEASRVSTRSFPRRRSKPGHRMRERVSRTKQYPATTPSSNASTRDSPRPLPSNNYEMLTLGQRVHGAASACAALESRLGTDITQTWS